MPQHDMLTQQQSNNASERVRSICYGNMTIYMLLFCGFSFLTFRSTTPEFSTDFNVGLFFMLWFLAMSFATAMMHIGVSVRRADFIFPCLVMSIVTTLAVVVYVFYREDFIQAIIGACVLIYILLTWHPIFVLYKKFLLENCHGNETEMSIEHQPLSESNDVRFIVIDENGHECVRKYQQSDNCAPPPSYESAMAAKT